MMARQMRLALLDLREALFGPRIWLHLAWQETRLRYRRSLIGPFWIVLSTAVMVAAMGPLYGHLLGQPLDSYFRHLCIGLVLWQFIASYLNESCFSFSSAEGFIRQVRLPYSVHVLKVLARHLMILAHNALVVAVVLVLFPPARWGGLPLALPGLLLVVGNLAWIGMLLALLGARFRDIPQVVASIVQLLFFVTPIMWQLPMLKAGQHLALFNPVLHLIEVVRAPLVGEPVAALSWFVLVGGLVLGSGLCLLVFARWRGRISYWL